MTVYEKRLAKLEATPCRWFITGDTGFIGSKLRDKELREDPHAVGLDNFAIGHAHNLELVPQVVRDEASARFSISEGDIRELGTCRRVCDGLHPVPH